MLCFYASVLLEYLSAINGSNQAVLDLLTQILQMYLVYPVVKKQFCHASYNYRKTMSLVVS